MNTTVAVAVAAANPHVWAPTLAYFVAFVVQGMIAGALGPALPGLVAQVGAPVSALSWLFAARALGSLLSATQGGRLYDRWPGHPMMAGALVGCAVLLALMPLAGNLWLLVALVALLGAAMGVTNMGGNTLLAWVHRERVAPYMNALHFLAGLGSFLSPLLVAWLSPAGGNSAAVFWLLALLMLPAASLMLWAPSPDSRPASTNGQGAVRDRRLVALFVLFMFCYAGAEAGFGSWLYSYAVGLGLADAASAAYLTAGFWGALTTGRLLMVPLTAWLRPRVILVADLVGALAGVGLILARPDSLEVLWVATLLCGFSMASVFPVALAFLQRRIPVTGRVTGYFLVGGMGGAIVSPWLIGALIESLGVGVLMTVIAVDLVVTGLVLTWLLLASREPLGKRGGGSDQEAGSIASGA